MSPTPVSFALPTAPTGYTWEATSEAVAERYGLPVGEIVRFDLNTSPAPPALAARILAAGNFDVPLSEYAPSDYRRLVEAAGRRYGVGMDEILVGAGADEILDIAAKAFLAPGGTAVIPVPTYAMYTVLTELRPASIVPVPRLPARRGFALDLPAVREAASNADLLWLCNPNNPTGLAEPDEAIAALLDQVAEDSARSGRTPPAIVLDEAYVEFSGHSLLELRRRYRRLVVVRTASKAYGLAGLRVGFALAVPETIAALAPFRPPGSVSVASAAVVAAVLADPTIAAEARARVERERAHLAAGLGRAGWDVRPSVTNFLLVDLGTPDRAASVAEALLRRGLVPRTFGSGHILSGHLRLTVRDRADDDRLIAAALEIGLPPVQPS